MLVRHRQGDYGALGTANRIDAGLVDEEALFSEVLLPECIGRPAQECCSKDDILVDAFAGGQADGKSSKAQQT